MPIIFASSLLIFPSFVFNSLSRATLACVPTPGLRARPWPASSRNCPTPSSGRVTSTRSCYIVLIYFFCYFWTAITFNPKDMADNLKDYGSFIPGYRPGRRTADYLEKVMLRITYVGAAFLALVAVIPSLVQTSLNVDFTVASFLGGTGPADRRSASASTWCRRSTAIWSCEITRAWSTGSDRRAANSQPWAGHRIRAPRWTSDCRYRPAIWYDRFRRLGGVELASIEEELERRVFPSRHRSPAVLSPLSCRPGTERGPPGRPTAPELEEPARDALMREAGRVVAKALDRVRRWPCRSDHRRHGRRRGRRLPGTRCHPAVPGLPEHGQGETAVPGRRSVASINEHVVHGIPNRRPLKDGDIVSIDTGCKISGWCGDSAVTLAIGADFRPDVQKLLDVTLRSLNLAHPGHGPLPLLVGSRQPDGTLRQEPGAST